MEERELILITGSQPTRIGLENQLKEYLPETVDFVAYSFEEGVPEKIQAKVVLLSGQSFEERLKRAGTMDENQTIVIAEKRQVNIDKIESIVHIPAGTEVLMVNDTQAAAMDAIASLKEIGFDTLRYIPFWQGASLEYPVSTAITAGEWHIVPSCCTTIYDIGIRLLSFTTMAALWKYLELPLHVLDTYMDRYVTKLVGISKQIGEVNRHADNLSQQLLSLIHSTDDSVLMYHSATLTIVFCNENMQELLGIKEKNPVGKNLAELIYGTNMLQFLTGELDDEDAMVDIGGEGVLASKFLLDEENTVCIFKTAERIRKENNKISRNLVKKGFYAKYTLNDILGVSPEIVEAKRRAERLSKTDLSVLIEGESGTGKEMFASAIHQASSRKDYPYVAVNFSALQESLMESELFGYEEGAFTGAKKGGKAGIFEMASGGTIFLDEIGDISPKMQIGLLRVLQEKEVMRVGGKEIKYVDVRIVAATNQNLQEKVSRGEFREDLYYRLKIGYLKLPTLRQRPSDIPVLALNFFRQEGVEGKDIPAGMMEMLEKYTWQGNVRELRNAIACLCALRDEKGIHPEDLPVGEGMPWADGVSVAGSSAERTSAKGPSADRPPAAMAPITQVELVKRLQSKIGEIARDYSQAGALLGRETLLRILRENGFEELSMYGLRRQLCRMEEEGLLQVSRGKAGIRLTEKGRQGF